MIPKSISEFQNLRKEGKISSLELTNEYIERIKKSNLNEYIYPDQLFESARIQAQESDKRFESGELFGDMDGVPMNIKDCISLKGSFTTNASKILKDYKSEFDAEVVARLRKAGAVFLGKGNTDEFTMGSSTETSFFGPSKNPHDITRVPGGSSGGVGASVGGDTSLCGIGTDTGGSIRLPAAYCGIAGLKVTYGRVSRYGTLAMASSFDTVGPMAKNCEDLAILMQTISGQDQKDATTSHKSIDVSIQPSFDISKLTIGLPKEYFVDGIESDVGASISKVIDFYKSKGAKFKEVSLPSTKYAVALYYILIPSEVSSNLACYDGSRFGLRSSTYNDLFEMYSKTRSEGFGDEVKRRILIGTFALSSGYYDAYYNKASKVRRLVQLEFDKVFQDIDVLLTPVTPTTAFELGGKIKDPLAMYLNDAFTIPANAAGIPALSVPCGFDSNKLPIGFQLMGPAFSEELLLNVGNIFEKS